MHLAVCTHKTRSDRVQHGTGGMGASLLADVAHAVRDEGIEAGLAACVHGCHAAVALRLPASLEQRFLQGASLHTASASSASYIRQCNKRACPGVGCHEVQVWPQ